MKLVTMPAIGLILLELSLFFCGTAISAERSVIRVGGNKNYPPYEFLDKNGAPAGYNVELFRAIAKVMEMDIEITLGPWPEMRRALNEGKSDILMGMGYTEDRTKSLDFSPPHTIINISIFSRKDAPKVSSLDDLRGKNVIVLSDGRVHEIAVEHGLSDTMVLSDTYAEALRLVALERYDYAVLATLPGVYLIRELELSNVGQVARLPDVINYSSAVKKGNLELLSRFSNGLAVLKKTGQYKEIHDKWLGVLEPQGVSWSKVSKVGAVVIGLFLSVLFITFVWSRTLKKEVSQRTAALAQEIRERQRAEEELKKNQQQLIQASKMTALGTLVSGVAHEINNPNGLILLNVPVLNKIFRDFLPILDDYYKKHSNFTAGGVSYAKIREELPQMSSEVLEASRRIRRIVEDLRDFGMRDDADLCDEVNLNTIIETAVRLVEPTIRTATRRFDLSLSPKMPKLYCNAQRIEQVVVNILLNACQALRDADENIAITTWYDEQTREVCMKIQDEGCGIPEDQLPYITDPFYTTKRDSGGTGLGLSVSTGIIKEHGGTLSFTSGVGQGTTVIMSFPKSAKR